MTVQLAPFANEREFRDVSLTGEWADALSVLYETAQTPPWCNYVVRRGGVVVGLGAFVGPPDEQAGVEIAYFTLIPYRRSGVAKQTAVALIEIAREESLHGVSAHTLPVENSSTAILRTLGFSLCDTAAHDVDEGQVWRWKLCLAKSSTDTVSHSVV